MLEIKRSYIQIEVFLLDALGVLKQLYVYLLFTLCNNLPCIPIQSGEPVAVNRANARALSAIAATA